MEIDPPVFESKILLANDQVPSQYRKDDLMQEIIIATSKFFEKDGRFAVAAVRKELHPKSSPTYVLYLYLYERYYPICRTQKVNLSTRFNYNKVFIQFSEHCNELIIFCGDYLYFFVPINWSFPLTSDEKNVHVTPSREKKELSELFFIRSKSELKLPQIRTPTQESAFKVTPTSKSQKLPKDIRSFLVWTSRGTAIGILVSRDGIIIFFDLMTSQVLKVMTFSMNVCVKEALLCLEDSNVDKISTFLVIVFETDFNDMTAVCCQQLEIKSLRSSEVINIFTKNVSESSLSRFVLKSSGNVKVHYFNNKMCLGYFSNMSIKLYSLYNQLLMVFDVCQSFPRSSVCFLNNKYLFQFSRLTDETHCCGIIPLMKLFDKTPPTQVINFGVDSNYFNVKGTDPFFINFNTKEQNAINNSQESSLDGCVLWNSYCITVIYQSRPKEAIFCHKFLNAKTEAEESSVLQLFSITQSVDQVVQTVSQYYVEKGLIEKAQRLCQHNRPVSLPLVKLNLINMEFTEDEFSALIRDCKEFIKVGSSVIDIKKYRTVLMIVELCKVIKFYIPNDSEFVALLTSLTKEEAAFVLPLLFATQKDQFGNYIIMLLTKYPIFIEDYINYVIVHGYNFIDFNQLVRATPTHFIYAVINCRTILATLSVPSIETVFFKVFKKTPSISSLQVIDEMLELIKGAELVELIQFLDPQNPLFDEPFPVFYDEAFKFEWMTVYCKASLYNLKENILLGNQVDDIQHMKLFVDKIGRWDLLDFEEIVLFASKLELYAICFIVLIYAEKNTKSLEYFVKYITLVKANKSEVDQAFALVNEIGSPIVKEQIKKIYDKVIFLNIKTDSLAIQVVSPFVLQSTNTL
ncbi:hypothetical protein EIN_080260 [Entamoeba invadens IP1]|uniref:hypothetical protein n=1 Tax=Entamoeba invadens IP1 TaxID=370355 RepID=UPI0002C3E992|nr:hypothetical protein EIN_080260 [Entamoeba invadens IP1]ELP85074.1 hypothetical protein EIN_080260 [Entamoeba invadens IP1]|eukprot:XP_004184420.1 hypothetical protein EIN_080260 [Entamoeba invadens IP1]